MARKCASEHGRIVAELLWAERLIGNPGGVFRSTTDVCMDFGLYYTTRKVY